MARHKSAGESTIRPPADQRNVTMSQATAVNPGTGSRMGPPMRARQSLVQKSRGINGDMIMAGTARLGGLTIIGLLTALLIILFIAARPAIKEFGFGFLVSTDWSANELEEPVLDSQGHVTFEDGEMVTRTLPPTFGALPVIYGTAVSSALALVFAVPLSLGAALFMIRICPKRLAEPVSFLIEFLAAIPSIAYGMWGLFVLAPILQDHVEPWLKKGLGWIPGVDAWLFDGVTLVGRDMFCGSLVLAIMVLPIITAISRDVLKSFPRAQIEGSLALGANWWQSSWEMLRYSRSALFGAVMLGLARAAGETMAITMVIGNSNQIHASLFAPAQTMSSLLANEFAEASTDIHRAALTEVALILLLMSLAFNVVARWLVVGSNARTSNAV